MTDCGMHFKNVSLFPGLPSGDRVQRGTHCGLRFKINVSLFPFPSSKVYPLAILYEEGLIVGCVSRLTSLSSASTTPLWSVERKTQLFLPQILLYLLRQNLGRVGLKIIRPLQQLPYFNHVLELLLHEVLEEEGTWLLIHGFLYCFFCLCFLSYCFSFLTGERTDGLTNRATYTAACTQLEISAK